MPGDEEWKTLEMVLGMNWSEADKTGWRGTDEGGKMKDTGTVHWKSPNTGATNESGFSGLPGGVRYFNIGTFNYLNHIATFWSSTEFDSLYVWGRDLNFGNAIVYRVIYHKGSAFSVRCVKD